MEKFKLQIYDTTVIFKHHKWPPLEGSEGPGPVGPLRGDLLHGYFSCTQTPDIRHAYQTIAQYARHVLHDDMTN